MNSSEAKPFTNNWSYLKTELRWLDRLLVMAVSRQRKDDKAIRQIADSPADKVTSHWWKGIITVGKGIDDREGPRPQQAPKPQVSVSYSQQLESRIQATHRTKTVLALPELRDRFGLSEVEKNILLIALAPEVNRRYGRLYNYLQEDAGALEDLPTVDLCLRLLCRSDDAWQQARARLTAPNSMAHWGLMEWIGDDDGTLLSQQVRVTDSVVNYLLADAPDPQKLQLLPTDALAKYEPFGKASPVDSLTTDAVPQVASHETANLTNPNALAVAAESAESAVDAEAIAVSEQPSAALWDSLVLPQKLIRQLQHLSRQAVQRQQHRDIPGLIVLLVGGSGTGKTATAGAIAADLGYPLTCVDLETLAPDNYPDVLMESPSADPSLLLVKQGEQWFGRISQVEQSWLKQWWQWRQQHYGLTLITTHALPAVRPSWRQKFDGILTLTPPGPKARQRLWSQAFPPSLKTRDVDWGYLAKHMPLTGGDIQAIARTVQMDLQARNQSTLTLRALRDAIALHHPQIDTNAIKSQR